MKRLWIGIGLLAVMLVSGLMIPEAVETAHRPVAEDLNRAADLALADSWDRAEYLLNRAEKAWKENRSAAAAVTDHEPMEEIDGIFARLKVYAQARDGVSFSSACVYLVSRLDALGDYHRLTLANLF